MNKVHKLLLLLIDMSTIALCFILANYVKVYVNGETNNLFVDYYSNNIILIIFMQILFSLIFSYNNLYKYNVSKSTSRSFRNVSKSIIYGHLILLTILFMIKYDLILERWIILSNFILLYFTVCIYRCFILPKLIKYMILKKQIGKKILVIGAGQCGKAFIEQLNKKSIMYFVPIGYLDDNITGNINGLPVLGNVESIKSSKYNYDEIVIAINNISFKDLKYIINLCKHTNNVIHIISEKYNVLTKKYTLDKFDYLSAFTINKNDGRNKIIKRLFDIIISVVLIIFLSPFALLISFIIKLTSKGPVFYSTKVIGFNKQPFTWYKFRTMLHENDDTIHREAVDDMFRGRKSGEKIINDPRVTKIGKYLRKYSIDELPQLFNVLIGQMSLVGPRPVLSYEFEKMEEWQKEKFIVTSGITGMWQVYGRNEVGIEDQFVLDIFYVNNQTFWLDLKIIIETIPIVIFGKSGV